MTRRKIPDFPRIAVSEPTWPETPGEPTLSRHWLMMNDDREITGCMCGFPASPEDAGYGDSILKHILEVDRAHHG